MVGDYLISLTDVTRFDLQDMGFSHCPCYRLLGPFPSWVGVRAQALH